MTLRTRVLVLGGLAAAFSGRSVQGQAVYSDPGRRFAVTLPAGWAQVPDSALESFARRQETDSTMVAAFYSTRSQTWFQYPYVLLQVQLLDIPVDPESLAAAIRSYHSKSLPVGSTSRASPAQYYPEQDLVRWSYEQPLEGGRTLRGYFGLRQARFGAIGIFVYGLAPDSIATAAVLDSLGAGLRIEPGQRYERGRTAAHPRVILLEALGGLLFLALAAGILVALRSMGRRQPTSAGANTGIASP